MYTREFYSLCPLNLAACARSLTHTNTTDTQLIITIMLHQRHFVGKPTRDSNRSAINSLELTHSRARAHTLTCTHAQQFRHDFAWLLLALATG